MPIRKVQQMKPKLDLLIKRLQNIYVSQGISFHDSFIHEIEQYYDLISTSSKTYALKEKDRIFVIVVVLEKAMGIAREKRFNVIKADLLEEALVGYKGPNRPPDDKCESAAIEIHRNRELYESKLSEETRMLLQAMVK